MNQAPTLSATQRNFRQNLLSMAGLCCVLIMVALDQTVIGTALPTVVAELKGFSLYAWVGTSYLLTSIITIPIFGKLGDEHGRKPYVLIAIALFTSASMLCGAAHDMLELVLARALQGVGGGMLMATAFASVPDLFPETRERLRWQILFSSSFGLANAFGPSLGGFITEYLGWRWVFFVNLPVGMISLWLVWRYLPRIRQTEHVPAPLDWLGALLIALTLGSLQLLVEWLPLHKPAALLVGLATLGAVCGTVLIWWERRCANPLLPLEMFTHPSLRQLFTLSLIVGFCMFAVMYYVPLIFQGGFGLSPNQAGLLITPLAVFITVGSIINGRIVTRLRSPNVILYIGAGFFWGAALALTQTTIHTPHAWIILSMMAGGIGLGLLLPNLTLFVQNTAPRAQLGVATAMLQSTRMIGGMLGMAIMGAVVSHQYAGRVNDLLQATANTRWQAWLDDPQILVNPVLAEQFNSAVQQTGTNAALLLAEARSSLVHAIHISEWLVVGLMILAPWVISRIPPININRSVVNRQSTYD
ncbi:MAG: MDR family MFS transporter [Pseudomonadota bacterium]